MDWRLNGNGYPAEMGTPSAWMASANSLWRRPKPDSGEESQVSEEREVLEFEVRGMRCHGCVDSVTRALAAAHGVAEVDVELTDADNGTGWAPYLSLEEAKKLDDVRRALKRVDLRAAAQFGRVFKLLPVAV